ncbi:MAG: hypothetical protein Kow0090_16080 [Myxococcota bacterium]
MNEERQKVSRRTFLAGIAGMAGAIIFGAKIFAAKRFGYLASFIRPPGAVEESLFLKKCIGCAKCMEACRNDCIRMLGAEAGMSRFKTPAIIPRAKGCTLCMECTKVCPTGALKRIALGAPLTPENINMGKAELNKSICYSYNGRTCGVCYRACPLQGKAMTIGLFERPEVHPEACVGCGLCEQACMHLPQAIKVLDRKRVSYETL